MKECKANAARRGKSSKKNKNQQNMMVFCDMDTYEPYGLLSLQESLEQGPSNAFATGAFGDLEWADVDALMGTCSCCEFAHYANSTTPGPSDPGYNRKQHAGLWRKGKNKVDQNDDMLDATEFAKLMVASSALVEQLKKLAAGSDSDKTTYATLKTRFKPKEVAISGGASSQCRVKSDAELAAGVFIALPGEDLSADILPIKYFDTIDDADMAIIEDYTQDIYTKFEYTELGDWTDYTMWTEGMVDVDPEDYSVLDMPDGFAFPGMEYGDDAGLATVATYYGDDDGLAPVAGFGRALAGERRQLYHSSYCPTSQTGCHPADTTLELADGSLARIDEVQVGTVIRTAVGLETITSFMHAEHGKQAEYFRFHTADASMAITKGHYLFVNGVERDPATVKEGEMLTTSCCGEQPIERIEHTSEEGMFHINTDSMTYFANGVLSSTYVAFVPLNVWKVAGALYPRIRYTIGVPITPEGQGVLSIFWLLNIYEAVGLPHLVRGILWPVTMTSTLFAEVVNTAVVQLPATTTVLTLVAAGTMRARK